LLNLDETASSALIGLAVSLVGTYLIAMRKGAETLDAGLRRDITGKTKEIQQQTDIIKKLSESPKRTPAEEHHYTEAARAIANLSPEAKTVAKHIYSHGKVCAPGGRIVVRGLTVPQSMDALNGDLASVPFIARVPGELAGIGSVLCWEIVQEYKSALAELLF